MPKIMLANGEYGTAGYEFEPAVTNINFETFIWRLLLLSALAYFVWSDNFSINIGHVCIQKAALDQESAALKTDFFALLDIQGAGRKALIPDNEPINNLTFALDPSYAKRQGIEPEIVHQRMQRCVDFIKQFSPVAIAEMRRFGIPASVLLAQALLASDAGMDPKALASNNFFLRNCETADCSAIHSKELDLNGDAIQWDVFHNLWGSFRAQSHFLSHQVQYSRLMKQKNKNIKAWVNALDAGHYSSNSLYGEKLLALIQALKLNKFDSR